MPWLISSARILRGTAFEPGDLAVTNGLIAEAAPQARRFDGRGLLALPGVVDIHGDAHERQLQPRPGIAFPVPLALRDSAAQIAAAGITTACLAITLSWEPGLRSLEGWRALRTALATPPPGAELRTHIRFEADNLDAVEEALADIAAGHIQVLSFNDHTPSILKKLDDDTQVSKYAARCGLSLASFRDLARRIEARRSEVPAARQRMAAAARAAGIPMLSHDDDSPVTRRYFRDLGAHISEFPITEPTALAAREAREHVVMGAPNVVRGGSHLGWASAAPLAERGIVTILASDYYWPALLEAAFILEERGSLSLGQAWALISANPADALGLVDRGRIAPGLRADIVLVDPARHAPVATFVAGELAWLDAAAASRLG